MKDFEDKLRTQIIVVTFKRKNNINYKIKHKKVLSKLLIKILN